MPNPNAEYSDDFVSDVSEEIGASLFGGDSTPPLNEAPPENATGTIVQGQNSENPPPAAASQGETPPQNLRPLPKSWKKDMEAHWAKLDPAVHEYVYNREADVMRGLQQYQQGYQQWENLLKPYAPIFQQHQDVNPIALMQGLMNSHLRLLNPQLPQQEKLAFARQIMQEYGIDLAQLAQSPAGQEPPSQQLDPRILRQMDALQNEVIRLKQAAEAQQNASYEAGVSEQLAHIEKFAKENPFFEEVGADVLRFIKSGAAENLQQAYELACYANPLVRVKYLAAQNQPQGQQSQGQGSRDQKTGRFVNLTPSADAKTSKKATGSIDETIASVIASHTSGN